MPVEPWLAFVVASVVLLIIPGPTVLTVVSHSMAHGWRANAPLIFAVALGDATALTGSLLGLGALLATSAFWFAVVKWVGGLYLLYLGTRLLRAGISAAELVVPAAPASRWRLFAHTYVVTALNPKGIVFFVAFLPQFVSANGEVARQLWILTITFVALATVNASIRVDGPGEVIYTLEGLHRSTPARSSGDDGRSQIQSAVPQRAIAVPKAKLRKP